MKAFNYITFIAMVSLTIACNEKISPKLLDANQSTTVPPIIEPDVYHFKVKNISPETRKFNLHKAGLGNYDKPCEIKATEKFSSSLYRDPSRKPEFDITCIFEAEELALEQKGFSFQFEASPNTCEYVGYSPFSFYNFKPGNSSASYTMVICEEGVHNGNISSSSANLLRPITANGVLGCNQMVINDSAIASTDALPRSIPADEAATLCRYNYSSRTKNPGPDCDVGEITINEIVYTLNSETNEIDGSEKKARTIKCGGKVSACIQGPIRDETSFDNQSAIVTVVETVKNKPFVDKREYGKGPRNFGNLFYANFRRNLASPHINYEFQPLEPTDGGWPTYAHSFENHRDYYPLLMENYSAGKAYNGVDDISGLTMADHEYATLGPDRYPVIKGISYAAEPFMGREDEVTGKSYRTSPYYTFYCLDSASEIRARVKMVVRDWDRYFPNDKTHFELISDIDQSSSGNSRIDNPFGVEFPGDLDPINGLNDINDWDDFLRMTRTSGPLDIVNTVWEPAKRFNSSEIFPEIVD